MSAINALLSVIFPDDCPACDGPGGVGDSVLCADCAATVPLLPRATAVPEPLAGGFALGPYAGPLGGLVRRAKYRPDPTAMAELSRRLASAADGRLPRVDAVTHVPVPMARRMRRGFDQGELLSRAVADVLGAPHITLLRRVRSAEQAGLDHKARRQAARGAFRLRPGQTLPRRLLLVDDVLTTGSTAAACADELLAGGASAVIALCVASAAL